MEGVECQAGGGAGSVDNEKPLNLALGCTVIGFNAELTALHTMAGPREPPVDQRQCGDL